MTGRKVVAGTGEVQFARAVSSRGQSRGASGRISLRMRPFKPKSAAQLPQRDVDGGQIPDGDRILQLGCVSWHKQKPPMIHLPAERVARQKPVRAGRLCWVWSAWKWRAVSVATAGLGYRRHDGGGRGACSTGRTEMDGVRYGEGQSVSQLWMSGKELLDPRYVFDRWSNPRASSNRTEGEACGPCMIFRDDQYRALAATLRPQSRGAAPRLLKTARMQTNLPSALYPPRLTTPPRTVYQCQPYGILPPFSVGSPALGHTSYQGRQPSASTSATGPSYPPSGYAYAFTSSAPAPGFPGHSAWHYAPSDKSRPPSARFPPQLSSRNMAIPYSQSGASATSPVASSSHDIQEMDVPREIPCSESPPPPQDVPQAAGGTFACDTCGRRFSVQSNLNRHAKKCPSRPVNAASAAAPASTAIASTSAAASAGASPVYAGVASAASAQSAAAPAGAGPSGAPIIQEAGVPQLATARGRKRKEVPTSDDAADQMSQTIIGTTPGTASKGKRVRRAPSPSHWIPESLKMFDLAPTTKSTPVPLSPVRPFSDPNGRVWEERDSYDENVAPAPYHPSGWKGVLPGPGLMGKDVANTSGGRLLIFGR
ncbi:predicted protein [Postia placenta Mad-698-R]|nr:predicted protein [Postia placenta Mad-698-R]